LLLGPRQTTQHRSLTARRWADLLATPAAATSFVIELLIQDVDDLFQGNDHLHPVKGSKYLVLENMERGLLTASEVIDAAGIAKWPVLQCLQHCRG